MLQMGFPLVFCDLQVMKNLFLASLPFPVQKFFDDRQALEAHIHRWTAGQKPLGIGMLRMVEDFLHRAAFQYLSVVHHGHIVGNLGHHTQVVGDENHAHAGLGLQLAQQFQDFKLHRHVQSRSRLVSDEELGVAGDGHRNHYALLLSSRKFVGIAVIDGLGARQHHLLEEVDDALLGGCFAYLFMLQNHLSHLKAAFIHGIQRGHRLLENHRDAFTSHLSHLAFAVVFYLFPFNLDAVGLNMACLFVQQPHNG